MAKSPTHLASWNVNGLRAVLGKGFADILQDMAPDVLCLQEIKAQPEQVDFEPDGYEIIWHSAERKGYSGTAMLTRTKPQSVQRGMARIDDLEGRVLTAEFPDYFLVTVYTPNAKRDLSRLPYRENEWDPAFKDHLKDLEKTKPVIFCGDLNVAHKEIDLANPKSNRKNAGFTDEERRGFDNLVAAGFVDTFRLFEESGGHYTWWSWRAQARERNIGWRIDYFGASKALVPHITASTIRPDIHGSDHCPVELKLEL